MMHEDRFYNQFKSQLENYAPEVPAAVYSGMRRKLWLSQFLKFNATSLNVWYVGTAIILGAGLWLANFNAAAPAQQARLHTSEISFVPTMEHAAAPAIISSYTSATCDRKCAPKCTKSQITSAAHVDQKDPIIADALPVVAIPQLTAPVDADGGNVATLPTEETTAAEVTTVPVEEVKPAKKTKGRKYKVPRY